MAEKQEPTRLEIKKYANRRFYNSTHSRHLKLEEMHALIKQGHDLHITDAENGADITAQVLTRMILEMETSKVDLMPISLLLWLIRINDQTVKDFVQKDLNGILKPLLEYQRQFKEQICATDGLKTALPAMSAWVKALTASFRPPSPEPAAKEPPAPPQATPAQTQSEDLGELLRELKRDKA
jgi:polyhydroxyalkanoate synthesis repressor PhaR